MSLETYQTPGLYITGSEPRPTEPLLTAVTGFVGVTARGPLNTPSAIRNWGQFLEQFGGFISYGYLPNAVYGFFLNGGEKCYVVRVARENQSNGFLFAQGYLLDNNQVPAIQFTAKIHGTGGNVLRVSAQPFSAGTALSSPQLHDDDRHFITLYHADVFSGDQDQVFTIGHNGDSETITVDIAPDAVQPSVNRLMLKQHMTGNYPVDAYITNSGRFNIFVREGDDSQPLEVFYNLSMDPQSQRYFKTIIDASSQTISASPVQGNPGIPGGEVQLDGGKDPGDIPYSYYTGYQENGDYFLLPDDQSSMRRGLASLEDIQENDITLVALPDLVHGEGENDTGPLIQILNHCRMAGDRFALLDALPGMDIQTLSQLDLSSTDPSFGALYYPWIDVPHEDTIRSVPPSGYIAGVFARTDRQAGVSKAPANTKIKGAVRLETEVDAALQAQLNDSGINCLRSFEKGEIKVWGARTLGKQNKWKYISTRRVFLHIMKTLPKELMWAVFEPNSRDLWLRIRSAITAFLNSLLGGGHTAGNTAGDAFYVHCNEETTPPEAEAAGQVIAHIGVALSQPAEFIAITVKKTPESLSVLEEDV